MSTPLAQALDLLGIEDTETVSGLSKAPGQPPRGFRVPVSKLRARGPYAGDRDYWIGLCPITPDGSGRGTAGEVIRVPALWADLDVKAGGLPSWDAAHSVVADLSTMLGTDPVYVTMSGHGLQPVWAVDGHDSRDVARAAGLLRRWGALVRIVARAHGGDADSVFDVARVLRAPGSVNLKSDPVPTTWEPRHGRPVSLDELSDTLDAYAVPDLPEDGVTEDHPAGSWRWADRTCGYVRAMVDGWATDTPPARHPWLLSACVRLTAAHRLGCITHDSHNTATTLLEARMGVLRAGDGTRPGEVSEALAYAVALVETMTAERCAAELRNHTHDTPAAPTLLTGPTGDGDDEDPRAQRGYIDWHRLWDGNLEDREYLIPGVWTEAAAGSIYSPAGAGKSLLGLEWAACLALGLPILGEPVKPRTVLYVDLENDELLVRERLEALGLEGADLPRLHYSLLGDWAPLDTAQGGRDLLHEARHFGAEMVMIDTTSRVISGEEDAADTFLALYRHTMRPLKAAGIATMRFDHAGKDLTRGERGSSAKRSDVDLTYRLTLTGDATVALKREKNRLHLAGPEVLHLKRTQDPLRHIPMNVDQVRERRIAELVDTLDRLGVPPADGRTRARDTLKAAGLKARNDELAQALARRRLNAPGEPVPITAPSRCGVAGTGSATTGRGQAGTGLGQPGTGLGQVRGQVPEKGSGTGRGQVSPESDPS